MRESEVMEISEENKLNFGGLMALVSKTNAKEMSLKMMRKRMKKDIC